MHWLPLTVAVFVTNGLLQAHHWLAALGLVVAVLMAGIATEVLRTR